MSDSQQIELAPGIIAPRSAMRFAWSRSSGPGGQNVNKLSTRAELWIDPAAIAGLTPQALQRLKKIAGKRLTDAGEIHLASDVHRGREANRRAVLKRLRDMVSGALVEPKVRRKTKPSRAARQRRLETKRRRSQIKSARRGQW